LTRDDIRRFYRKKQGEGLSNRTLSHIHTTLRKALKGAVGDDLIARNPTDGVKPPETPQGVAKEARALALDEVRTLLEEARGDRLEALYVVALCTGLRRGEVLGLKWSDIDLEAAPIGEYRMCQGEAEGLPNSSAHCQVQKVASLLAQALSLSGC
jgi:integrase